jgi:hypothetical protein
MTLSPSSTINAPPSPIAGVTIHDSRLAREVIELVKDIEAPLLFHHSSDYQLASAACAFTKINEALPEWAPARTLT